MRLMFGMASMLTKTTKMNLVNMVILTINLNQKIRVQLAECLIRLFVADRDPAHHTPPLSKGSKGGAAKWRRTATRRRCP